MACRRHDAVDQRAIVDRLQALLAPRPTPINSDAIARLAALAIRVVVFTDADETAVKEAAQAVIVPPGAVPTEWDRIDAGALAQEALHLVDQAHRAAHHQSAHRTTTRHAG